MNTQRPITTDDEHRVLKFRPRTLAHPPGRMQMLLGGHMRHDAAAAIDKFLAFKKANPVSSQIDIRALIEEGRE